MKTIVGANVKALIAARSESFEAACKATGMKPTQLKRVIAGKHAVTMTTIERIAAAYELHAYQLLVPGLDARNPQVLRQLSASEQKLYTALEDALEAAKKGGTQ